MVCLHLPSGKGPGWWTPAGCRCLLAILERTLVPVRHKCSGNTLCWAMSATDSVRKPVNSMGGHQEKGRGQVASRPSLAAGQGSVPAESLAEYS